MSKCIIRLHLPQSARRPSALFTCKVAMHAGMYAHSLNPCTYSKVCVGTKCLFVVLVSVCARTRRTRLPSTRHALVSRSVLKLAAAHVMSCKRLPDIKFECCTTGAFMCSSRRPTMLQNFLNMAPTSDWCVCGSLRAHDCAFRAVRAGKLR